MRRLPLCRIKFPENFFMLRGNHECAAITRIYGFYDECKRRYNLKAGPTERQGSCGRAVGIQALACSASPGFPVEDC